MFKHTTKIIALLFVIASISLFISCQEQQPVETTSSKVKLNKVTTFTLPAGATVVSADLYLYYWQPWSDVIEIHKVTAPWQENVVTWENFAGAYDPAVITTFSTSLIEPGWESVDITSTVQDWINCAPNNGLLLKYEMIVPEFVIWLSKENIINADFAPYLKIELSTGEIVELVVSADTYIRSDSYSTNYGSDIQLDCGFLNNSGTPEKQVLLKFDIDCTPVMSCETSYAYGEGNSLQTLCFLNIPNKQGNNWGWTNQIGPGTYDWPIYAGAGQCDISKGTEVGNLHVVYASGTVTITYQMFPGYEQQLSDTHVWVGTGTNLLPKKNNGKWDSAPGQFNHNGLNPVVVNGLSGNIWIAAHAGVCWQVFPD